jgi:transposase InsO family protein
VSSKITTDNASVFRSVELMTFCSQYNITLAHSTNYYPQGNGLAESSNKNLIRIIKKVVGENKRAWDGCLKFALWADRITKKRAIGKSPFELVYGLDVVLPVNLRLPVYKLLEEFTTNQQALQAHIDRLVQLDEDRRIAYTHFIDYQGQVKKVFDRKAKGKSL